MLFISKKHQILKELKRVYDDRSYDNHNYNEIGKSLSRDQLNIRTGIRIHNLDNQLLALISEELIDSANIEGKGETLFYYITSKGHNAFSDNRYVWFNVEKAILIITFLLALFGVLNSIFGWWEQK